MTTTPRLTAAQTIALRWLATYTETGSTAHPTETGVRFPNSAMQEKLRDLGLVDGTYGLMPKITDAGRAALGLPVEAPAREYLPEATAPAGTGSGAYVPDEDEVEAIAARYGVPADALRAEGDRMMRERAAALDAMPTDDEVVDEVAARHGIEVPTVAEAREQVRISTREELIARQIAAGVTPERAAMIADARDMLQAELTANAPAIAAALDEPLPVAPAEVERYRTPSGNRDEDRFRAVHSACGWRSLAWHSNRTVEGRRLAERDAREHRCAEPVVHLMSDALLDACDTAGPGGLHLAPSTTPERITCARCLLLAVDEEVQRLGYTSAARYLDDRPELRARVEVAAGEPDSTAPIPVDLGEADVPPSTDERVTVRIRASELRPGDEVVDSLGERQYAAFDVQQAGSARPFVKVWTAIRDQEAGLPPVIMVNAGRELLVLRPLSGEGRELLAALDRPAESRPEFGSPAWALSLLPENRHA